MACALKLKPAAGSAAAQTHPEVGSAAASVAALPGRNGHGVTTTSLRVAHVFANSSDAALVQLAGVSVLRYVSRRAHVFRTGDPPNAAFLVLAGAVNVTVGDEEQRGTILAVVGPGELFGEMGVLDGQARSATAVAVTPCVLVEIGAADFMRCMAQNPDVADYVMRKLVRRLRVANRRVESLALLDVSGRVVRLLHEMAQTKDGVRAISDRLSKQDIARMIGASREMVSRVMKDLHLRGLIDICNGRIVLHGA
jgi:CRP/FNR family cyclic AMP-dependent transcriptional regulator